jgi:hypothetical protein
VPSFCNNFTSKTILSISQPNLIVQSNKSSRQNSPIKNINRRETFLRLSKIKENSTLSTFSCMLNEKCHLWVFLRWLNGGKIQNERKINEKGEERGNLGIELERQVRKIMKMWTKLHKKTPRDNQKCLLIGKTWKFLLLEKYFLNFLLLFCYHI